MNTPTKFYHPLTKTEFRVSHLPLGGTGLIAEASDLLIGVIEDHLTVTTDRHEEILMDLRTVRRDSENELLYWEYKARNRPIFARIYND